MSSLRLKILRPVSMGPGNGGDKVKDDIVDCDENLGLPLVVCNQATYATLVAPTLTAISPTSVILGSQDEVIELTGTNFTPGAKIIAGVVEITTLYVNATKVQAIIHMSQFSFPVTINLKVRIAQGSQAFETVTKPLTIAAA